MRYFPLLLSLVSLLSGAEHALHEGVVMTPVQERIQHYDFSEQGAAKEDGLQCDVSCRV